nr:proline iminopeptidase [Saprospiraceae bacterium]
TLKGWNRANDLKNITAKTLVVGSAHDTMDPEHMEWMSKQIPGAQYLYCPNGSHMVQYDDQKTFFEGLIKFLKEGN